MIDHVNNGKLTLKQLIKLMCENPCRIFGIKHKGFIKETPDRNYLWAAQTPQGFLVDRLKKAHKMAIDKNWKVTDDASLFEMLNWKVKIIEGTYSNIKITSPIDLKIAKLFVKKP